MQKVSSYHPGLVILHWILALMIIASLTMGTVVLAHIPNTEPTKYAVLRHHMQIGLIIFLLMSLRFTIRRFTALPQPVATGRLFLDVLARLSHRGFYLLVFAQIATGLVIAAQADLPRILFMGEPGHLPATFWIYPARGLHYVISKLLMGLIALHLAGVAYHTFVRKDHILQRMWFRKRIAPIRDRELTSSS
jgi:cytochrome b561